MATIDELETQRYKVFEPLACSRDACAVRLVSPKSKTSPSALTGQNPLAERCWSVPIGSLPKLKSRLLWPGFMAVEWLL